MKQDMNMKDRHSKGDAREMQGRWQALGCFMEQLRSSLGAGYSMARVWVEYGYSMGRVWLSVSQSEVSELPVRSKRTVGPKEADSQSVGGVLRFLRCAVCVMMVMMGVNLWGQDYSGVYYIANDNTSSGHPGVEYSLATDAEKYYLVPAGDPQQPYYIDAYYSPNHATTEGDPDKPFLTTKLTKKDTNKDLNSIWIVKKTGNDYYFIHAKTGKYVIYEVPLPNDPNTNTNTNETKNGKRKTMHLQTIDDGDYNPEDNDRFKFVITSSTNNSTGNINIYSKKRSGWYWNPAGQNNNFYSGQTSSEGTDLFRNGLVGVYNNTGTNSIWHFESTKLPAAPTISDVDANNAVTVTDANGLPDGYNIRYTTDGTDPTASSPIMEGRSYTVTSSLTLKVVVERYGIVLTDVTEKALAPASCAIPTITFDNTTSMVSITCTTVGSTIYYTTNGSTPTASSTEYSGLFSVTSPTTVKAIATHATQFSSPVAELAISQVATPTIQNNGSNAISITCATEGATIYYTTDGSTPTTSSTEYTGPLTENVSGVTIKTIAVKENMITSAIGSGAVTLVCSKPTFSRTGKFVAISCSFPMSGVTIRYTIGGADPSSSSTVYSGTPTDVSSETLPVIVKAYASAPGYTNSEIATYTINSFSSGTAEDPYIIASVSDFTEFVSDINSDPDKAAAYYQLNGDIDASGSSTITRAFNGTLEGMAKTDGTFYTISNLDHALFNTLDGATIKNVILDNVTISGGTNVGAICNVATGETRIYNCGVLATGSTATTDDDGYIKITSNSSTISGSGYVGGIVGLLDGSSRVINCYSYAEITGGTHRGGIVGYNNVASTSGNLQTMVMNCMYYGDINTTGATQIAPIYCGEIIHNKYVDGSNTGLNNYCYFLYDEEQNPYVKSITTYNGSLGAETRFLSRFEFFRLTLNSTRSMAAFYACDDATKKEQMAKWVLDKSVAPYPILKSPSYYPSIVNPDAEHAEDIDAQNEHRNEGRKLGTLTVTINNIGSGAVFSAPTDAHLVDESGNTVQSRSLTLNVTDKDYANYNFNYKKIQLPYYSEVGVGNYSGDRVVTGWKITGFTGGNAGTFTNTGSEVTFDDDGNITTTPFNFVDRKCTNKDLYGTGGSNRVFNQGAYWEVPDGVTGITIEPYWAKAVYLSDANYDVTYSTTNKYGVTVGGACPSSLGSQTIYNNMGTAITNLSPVEGKTVYDYAVVLVGNYHQYATDAPAKDKKPFTIMSADLDGDREPDNTLFYYHNARRNVSPIRFDFLNMPGIGMVKRTHDATDDPEPGIFKPNGWFEITNTMFVRFGQFEYAEVGSGSGYSGKTINAPVILQGGIYEQFVSTRSTNSGLTNYLLVGGNAWFKNFANGCHTNVFSQTPKVPINVTGGDFENFYLTGIYQPNGNPNDEDAECYIDGGRFKEVAGAGMQRVDGNVTWLINGADITNFFGGGINDAQSITGNITTIISNSYVDEFYGGPKFGNMSSEKKVKTTATDCHFGKFFGAGYGGTSLNRLDCEDVSVKATDTPQWSTYLSNHYTRSYEETHTSYKSQGTQKTTTVNAISTSYDYEYILHSDGSQTVARFYVNFASLSLASTHDVISKLTGCTIGDFYGGGSLGAVKGDVTSTLTDCTVTGNAFGAGYSAAVPTVEVWPSGVGLSPVPTYDRKANVFNNSSVKFPNEQENNVGNVHLYKWTNGHDLSNSSPFYDNVNNDGYYIYTSVPLNNLGVVTGDVTLNIAGTTTVGKSVYGGGEESNVKGKTLVNISGGTITQNVFGGGKGVADDFTCSKAMVGIENEDFGGTNVLIVNGTVEGSVYGGGEIGRVEKNTAVTIGLEGDETNEPVIEHDVFGAGKGLNTHGYSALVRGNSSVTVQGKAKVKGSVYGGGEIASVGKYSLDAAGMPQSLANQNSGYCTVIVRDNAVIGPDDAMTMVTSSGYPDDAGHVFGAGMGVLPYEKVEGGTNGEPYRMKPGNITQTFVVGKYVYEEGKEDPDPKKAYLKYIETLGLATQTYVTISGNAFVKGSVYGGSMNGHVQHDTNVTIVGGQIGCGVGKTEPYSSDDWTSEDPSRFTECASWPFESPYAPFDIYDYQTGTTKPKPATDGHTFYGNVFGGGSGYYPYSQNSELTNEMRALGYADGLWHREAGSVGGNTVVNITGGHILTNVYGGNEQTDVVGSCTINMSGGTVGVPRTEAQMKAHPVTCYVFGAGKGDQRINFNTWTNVASTQVNISGTARIYGSTYGGGEDGHVIGDAETNIGGSFNMTINNVETTVPASNNVRIGTKGTSGVDGNIFGGGRGFSKTALTAGVVGGDVSVNIHGGTMFGSVFGGGRLASVGTYFANAESDDYGKMQEDDSNGTHGNLEITIDGGTIGATDNSGKLLVSEYSIGDVFGGCKGSSENSRFGLAKNTIVSISGDNTKVHGSVYGGGEAGYVTQDVSVTLNGGTVDKDFYGGGALAHTNTDNWDDTTWAEGKYNSDTYATTYKTNVTLKGGTIGGNVYGGGLGRKAKDAVQAVPAQGTEGEEDYVPAVVAQPAVTAVEAKVYGDVLVKLNETPVTDNCVVKGNIFGCNNLNGSPQSAVTVHVYKTQGWDGHLGTLSENLDSENNSDHNYHVEAVYGGGNLAAYMPDMKAIADTAQTHVIIDGCGETSIRQVYGGGNAASTPATNVTINGTYEIEEVFGGGNGLDDIIVNGETKPNPGANVGFKDYSEVEDTYDTKEKRQDEGAEGGFVENYVYGSGKASVTIYGGKIHRVFGGSNTKGNVRQTAVTMLQDLEGCDFCVDEAYGGGKSAPMDAEAQLLMACIPGLKAAYGGAQDADIQDNVVLTITNGTFDRVFGGNNVNGKIQGTITVNIEETGCKPLIIGQLYGGGNQAPYTAPSGEHGPTLNVKSFTSIGDIYGGGYGETAVVEGDTYVNINVSEGKYAKDAYTQTTKTITFNEYQRNKDGEGEDSFVHDNDGKRVVEEKSISVILPGHDANKMGAIYNVFGGGNAAKVKGNTHVNIGSQTGDDVVFETPLTKVVQGVESATTSEERTHTVLGADIRGNIYGGGNNAEVTGDTNVQIGKKVETSTTPEAEPTPGP